ncbi:30S ribosome-binding factor RbfA [Clostridium sp. 19966]|uniref:30S ribosome-binding factor RbfA n=1 Tax=Clostridium sp. 19966 TaxID=2768166 RepID=UPI0028DEE3CB|nr:30S ribosome-binding factor RbfA [Clostridium sp. 19966]MDT8716418.1 30S ribosome-binding factor RbfA [Clostridium sp. 19966]
MANYRNSRINEEIKKELSDIIRNNVKDPRITAMVSITDVNVTKDLRYAKVYVSIFGNAEEIDGTFAALKNSAGFMRKELGNRINIRYIPQLIIEKDNSIENGMHIEEILHKIKGE